MRYHDSSCTMWARASNYANSHSSEQGTLPTAPLISKQAVPYWTREGTYCPGVSTPRIQSLADSSKTNHITWRIPTLSTIPTFAQTTTSNLTTIISHHERWKTNTLGVQHKPKLNIINMEDLYDTQDCRAKQNYPSIKPKS
jgi:hypothetical protein